MLGGIFRVNSSSVGGNAVFNRIVFLTTTLGRGRIHVRGGNGRPAQQKSSDLFMSIMFERPAARPIEREMAAGQAKPRVY